MLELYENIKKRREELGISQEELAERMGYKSRSSINKIEKGINDIPQSKIVDFAKALSISPEELMGWRTYLMAHEKPNKDGTFELPPTVNVPVIGSVRCGPGGLAYEYLDDEHIAVTGDAENMRGFHVEGDSMEGDRIYEGDTAVVHLQPEVENGQLAVVVIDGEEGTLKRVYLHRNEETGALTQVILSASNPKYPPRVFTGEKMNQIRIVGRVVEVRRQM